MSTVNQTSSAVIEPPKLSPALGDYFDFAAGCGGELS
jgi:hypothetical protein